MKKIFAPIALFALVGILFSSCSNISKMSITKRHYRSGYYVDFGGSHSAPIPSVTKPPVRTRQHTSPVAIAKSESYIPIQKLKINSPVISAGLKTIKTDIAQKIISPNKIPINNPIIINSNSTYQNTFKLNTYANNDIAGAPGDERVRTNDDGIFILIVLCAIFIPPLGVGLMYGIDSYFWIDLLLTLLFFFPGMIFALVVVLM